MSVRSVLTLILCSCVGGVAQTSAAATITLTMEDFIGPSPASQYNGQSVSANGFTLSSLVDGIPGSQLAIAGNGAVAQGLGVGTDTGTSIGFTRSINNNGTNSESIDLEIGATAGGGLYAYLASVSVVNFNDSIVAISGFAEDPGATVTNGAVSYAGNVLTWEGPLAGGIETVSFTNPAATPIGTTLNLSNAQTNASQAGNGNNQYGLHSFAYVAIPEPFSVQLSSLAVCAMVVRRRRS